MFEGEEGVKQASRERLDLAEREGCPSEASRHGSVSPSGDIRLHRCRLVGE